MDEEVYLLESHAYGALVELMRPRKAMAPWSILIVFEPDGRRAVYSNASATGLVPVLRDVADAMETGRLAMPLDPARLRWIEEKEAGS